MRHLEMPYMLKRPKVEDAQIRTFSAAYDPINGTKAIQKTGINRLAFRDIKLIHVGFFRIRTPQLLCTIDDFGRIVDHLPHGQCL